MAAETVTAALAAGISLIDVAPHYGQGLAERRLGHALAAHSAARYAVSTKVGRVLEPAAQAPLSDLWPEALAYRTVYSVSREGILRSIADSRERTGRPRLDILLLHDPDRNAGDAASCPA